MGKKTDEIGPIFCPLGLDFTQYKEPLPRDLQTGLIKTGTAKEDPDEEQFDGSDKDGKAIPLDQLILSK